MNTDPNRGRYPELQEAKELRRQREEALQRRVVALRAEGLNATEIGRRLGIGPNHVWGLLRRAQR